MNFITKLEKAVEGEVKSDLFTKKIYSSDASIFEVMPEAVLLPKSYQDLEIAVSLAQEFQVPITARGAATGTAGGCLGAGLVIDYSKYLNSIVSISPGEKIATVQPGVVQNALNQALEEHQLRLGPNTSTGNRATIGGMVGSNSAGAHSLKYGMMGDSLSEIDLLLDDSTWWKQKNLIDRDFRQLLHSKGRQGEILRKLHGIGRSNKDLIKKEFPDLPRRVSGYNLDTLGLHSLNLPKLSAGSEGTFGLLGDIRVNLVQKPKFTGICVLGFEHLTEALKLTTEILSFTPLAFEMVDREIMTRGQEAPMMRGKTAWLSSIPEILFIIEFEGESSSDLSNKLNTFQDFAKKLDLSQAPFTLTDPGEVSNVWQLREAGLGLLMSKRSYSRAIAFIEDLALPPEKWADFMPHLLNILEKHEKKAGFYGHIGPGCLHIRPYIDLRDKNEKEKMVKIIQEVIPLIKQYGGALSGEHGDGLVRTAFNPDLFGEKLYSVLCEVKDAFDPTNMFNPGKVVRGTSPTKNIRNSAEDTFLPVTPLLNFEKEGGFTLSVDMCNGNGQCRKSEGLMCPTFQATGDEFYSTRARANALKASINGTLDKDAFTSKELYNVLDHCIECKGCKTECPSSVDMAKLKSEFLYHFQEKHGRSWRSKLFANIGLMSKLASNSPNLANLIANSPPSKWLLEKIGVEPKRALPLFSKKKFSSLYKKHIQKKNLKKSCALIIDTFTEFNYPEIGLKAIDLLNKMGYHVEIIPWSCCGRPMISKGFLPEAKIAAKKLMTQLQDFANKGYQLIGLEPSCFYTIVDDFPDLLPEINTKKIREHLIYIDSFIAEKGIEIKTKFSSPLYIHNHCYQKSIGTINDTTLALSAFEKVHILPTSCCGMAGSFGYEIEHQELSQKIAQTSLIPEIDKMERGGILIANGLSCRSQISHFSNTPSYHIVEFLDNQT